MIRHADVIDAFQKQINDYPDHGCCSFERLHQRKAVKVVKLHAAVYGVSGCVA